jgi:indolepyruvate ferredoxin oxidoreductase alpha subunit
MLWWQAILGARFWEMNPPFNTVWNEVSMGTSVSLAQGICLCRSKNSRNCDNRRFHLLPRRYPGLINAIQHQVDMTLIIMDNRWTAMTGMQINPGTPPELHHKDYKEIDIAKIVPALGVDQFFEINPFDQTMRLKRL